MIYILDSNFITVNNSINTNSQNKILLINNLFNTNNNGIHLHIEGGISIVKGDLQIKCT